MIKVGNKPEGTYLAWLDVTAAGRQDRRAEDGGRGKQEAAADQLRSPASPPWSQPDDMVGHWFAKNAFVALNPGTTYGMGGAQPYAHEHRHLAQDA